MAARYAIYFAPAPDTEIWQLGSTWLGRDAYTGKSLFHPAVPGLTPEELDALTDRPRRYGFHATLKAPFRLAKGTTEGELEAALAGFATEQRAFDLPGLALVRLRDFIALTPQERSAKLDDLAAACVQRFDDFRAPLRDHERARFEIEGLNERQQEYLDRWGYPYVLDEFRFHMTLSNSLDDVTLERIRSLIEPHMAFLANTSVHIDGIALFVQEEPNGPFQVRRRFEFENAVQTASA